MKRYTLVAALIVMLVPALVLAANTDKLVAAAKAAPSVNSEFTVVPLEVQNTKDLVAMDIPLSFTEGATLDHVEFTDRVKDFEVKIANIDNENHQVVMGLITMVSHQEPDMAAGSGTIANLYFKLDPGVNKVELTPVELSNPNHSLTYYYNDYSSGAPEVKAVHPEMAAMVIPGAGSDALPTSFGLMQNSPNPFNPTTTISYALPEASDVRISVFNILGQNVKDLVNSHLEAGVHEVVWDGKDASGDQVASGIYFYKISANNFTDTKKMVLLK
jgi:hypothetical protein